MREPYREGKPSLLRPEPCDGRREAALEALDWGNLQAGADESPE